MKAALATEDPWGWKPGGEQAEVLASLKRKIQEHHLQRHGGKCCYCRVNLHGAGHFMTDREHVLPKSFDDYRPLSYTMWNLGVACKRCNMEYKGDKVNFLVDPDDLTRLTDGSNYHFIHPNFDLYRQHLARFAQEANEAVMVKYTVVPGSAKGTYTHEYFNLRGLEVDSFDQAQGRDVAEDVGDAALEVRSLADTFGQ
ncbi:hypothetical protein GGR62_004201 [Xanthomonas campestris]|nr:hypothetical protein [Xanthomonas sp. 3075]